VEGELPLPAALNLPPQERLFISFGVVFFPLLLNLVYPVLRYYFFNKFTMQDVYNLMS
jgi:hypothetical protein